MNIRDLISKKKQGCIHTKEEIDFIVDSYTKNLISDAQMSAWITAVCFKGLSLEETANFTLALGNSGSIIKFKDVNNDYIVDKHSTGGVGDKLTITLIPLLAAAGVPVAKLADRGNWLSAGTVDKLESIPNLNTSLSVNQIIAQLKNCNAVISSQDDDLAPAEKKLYVLRNDIAAIDSDALIASSIISKKIATGANNIIVDVKYGVGAIKQTSEQALELSNLIVDIGRFIGKNITVIISSMEEPLGRAIGNSLEIIEALDFLKGHSNDSDLAELTYSIAATILLQLDLCDNNSDALKFLKNIVSSGKAIDKCKELIDAQGGNVDIINNYDNFVLPAFKVECEAKKNGYVHNINAHDIYMAAKSLGAMRENDLKPIDLSVGIFLNKKSGEKIEKGDVLYTIYSNSEEEMNKARSYCDEAFLIKEGKPNKKNLVYKIISTKDEEDDV